MGWGRGGVPWTGPPTGGMRSGSNFVLSRGPPVPPYPRLPSPDAVGGRKASSGLNRTTGLDDDDGGSGAGG